MKENTNEKNAERKSYGIISLRTYLSKLKTLFRFWLIAAVIMGVLVSGYNVGTAFYNSEASTVINFSFDGIESGLDPNGNKFDVEEIKDIELVRESLEELGITGVSPEAVVKSISITGVVPTNVIERITQYSSFYGANHLTSSKNIRDTTYYPTQYAIVCESEQLSKNEKADLLNKLTEKYNGVFYGKYGYNLSLESAVRSIDYKEYDYINAIDVFSASLGSLQNYIDELAAQDNTRFRAENGYTFADVSASIDTIRTEDLDWISSYITLHNVTKDKDTLIANYEFKIEELERSKAISQEQIKSINSTIDVYEKDAIIIFGDSAEGSNTTLNQSSETYNNLITQKVAAQTQLSTSEQKIDLYKDRINSLRRGKTNESDKKIVEKELERFSAKIDSLLEIANQTASEYYEEVKLSNAYAVLRPAESSTFGIITTAVTNSLGTIITFGLLITGAYFTIALVMCFREVPFFNRLAAKVKKSVKAEKKSDDKNKKNKKNKK